MWGLSSLLKGQKCPHLLPFLQLLLTRQLPSHREGSSDKGSGASPPHPLAHRGNYTMVYKESCKPCFPHHPTMVKMGRSWGASAQLFWNHHSFTGTRVIVLICFLGLAQTCQVLTLKTCRGIHHIFIHSFPYAKKLLLGG